MKPLRILWLSPWLRGLARVHVDALAARGHRTLLVTSNANPESFTARADEIVANTRLKDLASWHSFGSVDRQARSFALDVVVGVGALAPRVALVHDDRPHDAAEERPGWERRLFDRWTASAAAVVVFSEYVGSRIRTQLARDVDVIPLTSDLPQDVVPGVVPAAGRKDFIVLGRLNPYKNLDVVFRAWEAHVTGNHWQGDDLVLIGDGSFPGTPPPHIRWCRGSYTYAATVPTLAAAKGLVVHYRRASQSGIQVLAMQLGVAPMVSDQGALPEFQPAEPAPLDRDDVTGLTGLFDRLAHADEAARLGREAAAHYRRQSCDKAAARLDDVLTRVVGAR